MIFGSELLSCLLWSSRCRNLLMKTPKEMFNCLIRDFLIKSINQKNMTSILTKFNQEREVIIQACYLLTLHSDDLYQKVTSLLDELEDHVTIYCLSRSKPDTQLNQEEIEKLEQFNNIFFVTFVKVLEAIKTFP